MLITNKIAGGVALLISVSEMFGLNPDEGTDYPYASFSWFLNSSRQISRR
jgi:hypothetical protein